MSQEELQQAQEDGSYLRLNSTQIMQGLGDNMTISVVGKMVSVEGPLIQLRSTDGGTLNLMVGPDFSFVRVRAMYILFCLFFKV